MRGNAFLLSIYFPIVLYYILSENMKKAKEIIMIYSLQREGQRIKMSENR
jgi:hypothetical protein